MNFDKSRSKFDKFSFRYYSKLLEYFNVNYNGQFCNPLPKEVAEYVKEEISEHHFEVTA